MTDVLMFPDYRGHNPYQGELAEALGKNGVEVAFPSGYRRGLHFTRTLRSAAWNNVEWLHLHWPDIYLRGQGGLWRRLYALKLRVDLSMALRGRKLAWTVHNLGSHDSGGDSVEKDLYRWLARKARVIFVHDESLVAEASERLGIPESSIVVIPHGHYRNVYGEPTKREEACRKLGINPEKNIALFLGMLRPYKGLDELLEVWPAVKKQHSDALLLIAGGGRDTDYIERIRRRCEGMKGVRLEPRFVADEEIPVFYGAADVAVLPFRAITTSGSLILALSYDCPVVTPKVPSISGPLAFQKDLLFPAGSLDGLKQALAAGIAMDRGQHAMRFKELRAYHSWATAARLTKDGYSRMG